LWEIGLDIENRAILQQNLDQWGVKVGWRPVDEGDIANGG